MVGGMSEAHYVIIGNSLSKTYHDLITQATAANKLPLRQTFISDCAKHEGLLNENDYVLEDYVPPKKRGRPSLASTKPKPDKANKEKASKKEKIKATPKKAVDPIPHNGPPYPSLPPGKDQANFIGGLHLLVHSRRNRLLQMLCAVPH